MQCTDTWFPDWLQLCTLIASLWVVDTHNKCPFVWVAGPSGEGRVGMVGTCGMPEIDQIAKMDKVREPQNIWFVWAVVCSAEIFW